MGQPCFWRGIEIVREQGSWLPPCRPELLCLGVSFFIILRCSESEIHSCFVCFDSAVGVPFHYVSRCFTNADRDIDDVWESPLRRCSILLPLWHWVSAWSGILTQIKVSPCLRCCAQQVLICFFSLILTIVFFLAGSFPQAHRTMSSQSTSHHSKVEAGIWRHLADFLLYRCVYRVLMHFSNFALDAFIRLLNQVFSIKSGFRGYVSSLMWMS